MKARYTSQAAKEVTWLIRQSGITATVTRPVEDGEGTFFGPTESDETEVGDIAIELVDKDPKDLVELGADAVAHVLADSGVHEQDFVAVDGVRYRATAVKPHRFFGTVSHLELHLVRERRDG
jgi:RecA/RadA recombinase